MMRTPGKKRTLMFLLMLTALLLFFLILGAMLPAQAEESGTVFIGGIPALNNTAEWTAENGTVTRNGDGSITVTPNAIITGCIPVPTTIRLYFRSITGQELDISFRYALESGYTFSVDGHTLTGSGEYTLPVAGYGEFTIEYTGGGIPLTLSDFTQSECTAPVVTFYTMYGAVTPQSMPVYENGRLSYLPLPQREGYSFAGWYTEPTGGRQLLLADTYLADTVVYAHWESASGQLAQRFDFNEDSDGDWEFRDRDGDGRKGFRVYADPMAPLLERIPEGRGALVSQSWTVDNGALDPDNWMVSPKVTLRQKNVSLALYAAEGGSDPAKAEHFAVYVGTSRENLGDMTCVSGGTDLVTVGAGEFHRYTVDLSAWAGMQVYIAIRHFNSAGQHSLALDMLEIYGEYLEYDLFVAGTQVTGENEEDILGDGSASYDEDSKILTLSKDITSSSALISSGIDGLTVNVTDWVTLTRTTYPYSIIQSGGSMIVTGTGTLTLTHEDGNGENGIIMQGAGDTLALTVNGLQIDGVQYGLRGGESAGNKLYIEGAGIHIQASKAAVTGFNGGVDNYFCDLLLPEPGDSKVSGGSILHLDDTPAREVLYGSYYSLYIDGVRVNDANKGDVLGNGAFSYSPVNKQLTIHENYMAGSACAVKNAGINGLIVQLEKDATLTGIPGLPAMELDEKTTIRGDHTLSLEGENNVSLYMPDAAVTLDKTGLLCSGDILGSGSAVLRVKDSNLIADSVYGMSDIVLTGCEIVTPEEGKADAGMIVDQDGYQAMEVKIRASYPLTIDGVAVNGDNRADILGDGVFSFDGNKTLTVAGDHIARSGPVICNEGIDGLVIRVAADSVLSSPDFADETAEAIRPILLKESTCITGEGRLTVRGSTAGGILQSFGTLTILDANVTVTGRDAILGESGSELEIVNSTLTADGSGFAAVSDFSYGVKLTDCDLVKPLGGYISDGGIYGYDDYLAVSVTIEPTRYFDLYIDSVQVSTENWNDVLGDGYITFGGGNSLTISAPAGYDYGTVSGAPFIACGIDDLTVCVQNDVELAADTEVIRVKGMTLYGPGKLTVTSRLGGRAVAVEDSLTVSEGSLEAVNGCIAGIGPNSRLRLTGAELHAVWSSGAVTGFSGGITAESCRCVSPAAGRTAGGSVLDPDGIPAMDVYYTAKSVVPVSSVILTDSLELLPGQTASLSAALVPSTADYTAVYWSSSDPMIAAVAADGTVTAGSPGLAEITVYASGCKAVCRVTVVQQFDLYIKGVRVSTRNAADVLGDGLFSYDPSARVLTVRGDSSTDSGTSIVSSDLSSLTIRAERDCVLYSEDASAVYARGVLTITGPGTLQASSGDSAGISLLDGDLLLDHASVAALGKLNGVSSAGGRLTLVESRLYAFGEESAIAGFSSLSLTDTVLQSPFGGHFAGGAILNSDDSYAKEAEWTVYKKYDLYVNGTQVTTENMEDILHDGMFAFDGTDTLTIQSGSLNTGLNNAVKSSIPDLVIRVEGNVSVRSPGASCFMLWKDSTITGSGRLEAVSEAGEAIYMRSGASLTLTGADIRAVGQPWGIMGGGAGSRLSMSSSILQVKGSTAALIGFDGGIELTNDSLAEPPEGKAAGGELHNGDDSRAGSALILPVPQAAVTGSTLTYVIPRVPEAGAGTVVAAWYDAGGRLLGMRTRTVTLGNEEITGSFTVKDGACSYRVFLVDEAWKPILECCVR